MRTYQQLTQEQRYQIFVLKKMGHFPSKNAEVLGVDKSTVGRELKRNSGKRGYRPQQAQTLAWERRHKGECRITARTWVTVARLLRQEWSPEQISGRLKKEQGPAVGQRDYRLWNCNWSK
jgi:IS30 family transposase